MPRQQKIEKLELLEWALEGIQTYCGLYSGQMGDEEADEKDRKIEWLKKRIEAETKRVQAR